MQPYSDEYFMNKALEEAHKALQQDEVPIGAIIVHGQTILGKGSNMTEALQDVTAHAEMLAITASSENLSAKYLRNCTLYCTLEPCAMCAAALNLAQIKRLVYGATDSKKGYTRFSKQIIHKKIEVVAGVKAEECADLLTNFFKAKR